MSPGNFKPNHAYSLRLKEDFQAPQNLLTLKTELDSFKEPMVLNNFTMHLIERISPDLALVDVDYNPKDAFVTHTTF